MTTQKTTEGAVSKTVFTFTVLHPSDTEFEDLAHALQESYDGHSVGAELWVSTETVPNQDVPKELVKLGNDGSFFDYELGLEDNEEDDEDY